MHFKDPLLNIALDHVIVDELHLLLRVTDVLMTNLITEAMGWNKDEGFEKRSGAKNVHLEKLINTIQSCGVSFQVWKKKMLTVKRVGNMTGLA
jgi:hypothetical protein